jgi:hypothetical protein
MALYMDRGMTRLALVSSVFSLSAPTVAELNAGINISTLIADLQSTTETQTVNRTPWNSRLQVEDPVRYSQTHMMTGYRHTSLAEDILWVQAKWFRQRRVLVVRRGVASATAWAAGQRVEVMRFKWGKRAGRFSGAGAGSFTVPLFAYQQDDDALVVA